MKFRRSYLSAEAARKLGIEKRALWKAGEAGKIRMYRDGLQKVRVFDADEIDALAPRMKRNVPKGVAKFPDKAPPPKRKPKRP